MRQKSFFLKLFEHEKGLGLIIDGFLDWKSVFALKYSNKLLFDLFRHPYIRHIQNHYTIRDGHRFTENESLQFLKNTRSKFGTELVECAIFENYKQICIEHPVKFSDSWLILDTFHLDHDIDEALRLSKWSLYYSVANGVSDNRHDRVVQEKDLVTSSDYSFRSLSTDPLHSLIDHQLEYIFIKTELPIFYRYIFARRLLRYRDRCRVLYDSFGLEV